MDIQVGIFSEFFPDSGGGMGSEKAIQRIVELSKKNRELQCKLGSETAAKNKLAERLNNFNNQVRSI